MFKIHKPENIVEVEQTIVRIVFCSLLAAYSFILYRYNAMDGVVYMMYLMMLPVSIFLMLMALNNSFYSSFRRNIAVLFDTGTTSFAIMNSAEPGSVFIIIYYWVTIGHGIRFGVEYLLLSAFTSIVGFLLATFYNPFWNQHPWVVLSVMLSLITLPAYSRYLIEKLNQALKIAKDSSEAKSTFLANMSHEIRTPLNGLVGMSDMLATTDLDKKQKEISDIIRESTLTLKAIIDDILDLSKIESGEFKVETHAFNLYQTIHSVEKIFSNEAEKKALDFKINIATNVPFNLMGDEQLIKHIMMNLLSNAIKFTEHGHVHMNINLVSQQSEHAVIFFEVEDTGIGIEDDKLQKIFNKFNQADSNIRRYYGGTGLGTTIARNFVELLGGKMGVTSTVGAGTKFWFKLPLQTERESQAPEDSIYQQNYHINTIYIFDEDNTIDARVYDYLTSWGRPVKHFTSSHELNTHITHIHPKHKPGVLIVAEQNYLAVIDKYPNFSDWVSDNTQSRTIIINQLAHKEDEYLNSSDRIFHLNQPINKTRFYNLLHYTWSPEYSSKITALEKYRHAQLTLSPLSILVCDDNSTNLSVIRNILEFAGHAVETVKDEDDFLDIIIERDHDLIIMDLNLKQMTGIEVYKSYLMLKDKPQQAPFIILTADATPETEKECKEAGIEHFMVKPVTAEVILAKIAILCSIEHDTLQTNDTNKSVQQPLSNQELILDTMVLNELLELNISRDALAELVTSYISEANDYIHNIEVGIKQGRFKFIHSNAHTLKGASLHLGTNALAAQADALEKVGISDNDSHINGLYNRLCDEYTQAVEQLQWYLSTLKNN